MPAYNARTDSSVERDFAMTTEGEWKITVNTQYQEAIKIVINLVTASLVLPVVFLKNIIAVAPNELKSHLWPFAYAAWVLLGVSLSACLAFYFYSMKFAKAVYKGQENQPDGVHNEKWRDVAALVAAPAFLLGLGSLVIFFLTELRAL
jgi:hypothetical protein